MEELKSISNLGYRKLIVFQKARRLVLYVYKATKEFPREEIYSLTSQIRRSAVSIPANIVEGYSKSSRKDFVRFLDISIGSANELEFHLELSVDLGYLKKSIFDTINNLLIEVKKLLYAYQKSLRIG